MTLKAFMVEVGEAWGEGGWDTTSVVVFAHSDGEAERLAEKEVTSKEYTDVIRVGSFIYGIREAEEWEYPQEKWVAISERHWGKGPSGDHALEQLYKAGFNGRKAGRVRLAELPNGITNVHVNEMGSVIWDWEDPRKKGETVRLNWIEL